MPRRRPSTSLPPPMDRSLCRYDEDSSEDSDRTKKLSRVPLPSDSPNSRVRSMSYSSDDEGRNTTMNPFWQKIKETTSNSLSSPVRGRKGREGSSSAQNRDFFGPQEAPISVEHWNDFHRKHHGHGYRFSAERLFEINDMGRNTTMFPRVFTKRR